MDAQADAGDFVGVGGADAAAGGADGALAQEAFLDAVECLVVGRDEVRVAGDAEARGVGAAGFEAVDFVEERFEVDNDAVAQDWGGVLAEHACRQQFQFVLFAAHNNRVACVVTAVGFDYVVDFPAEDIGGFALPFVAPLGADNDDGGHSLSFNRH